MSPKRSQAGFSLLETVFAILILSFGVLALAAVFGQGMMRMNTAQYDYIAQQKAAEAIETIFTARDTRVLTWAQIQNVGGAGGGIFLVGPQPMLDPGPDGLVGTGDDDPTQPDAIIKPGPNGIMGTAQDVKVPLTFMTRQIQIQDIAPNLRQITVTIQYNVTSISRTVTVISYISSFA